MSSLSKPWLDKAADDLTVGRLVLSEGHRAHACFLAQQCMEKSLKAFLVEKTKTYPRTHKLVDLLKLCEGLEPTFSHLMTDCLLVDEFYIPTRYPDGVPGGLPAGMPSEIKAQAAIDAADKTVRFVSGQIP
jgi:HEPN domain-containing protein